MCYNCGCGIPDNNMGSDDNITTATFDRAAEASDQTPEEAKREVLKMLQEELPEEPLEVEET